MCAGSLMKGMVLILDLSLVAVIVDLLRKKRVEENGALQGSGHSGCLLAEERAGFLLSSWLHLEY